MSLINQVLNDLDKRGVAKEASGDETVRVVPVQSEVNLWLYVSAGVLLIGVAAAIWLSLRKPAVPEKPVIVALSVPISTPASALVAVSAASSISVQVSGVLPISHTLVESQVLPVSPPASAVEPTVHIVPNISRIKPVVTLSKPSSVMAAKPTEEKQSKTGVKSGAPAPANKQIKNITPQQQAETEFSKAYLLAQKGRLQEAIIGYQQALRLDPTHVMARESLVAALQESKQYTEAENVLKEALALDEKQTHFAMLLARLQVERNAVPVALETLQRSLPYAERMADYQAFMAALLQRQERYKEAITFYQNALQLSPLSGLWLMGLGISLQADQQKDEALNAYKRAIETHNLSPDLQAFVEQRIKELKPK